MTKKKFAKELPILCETRIENYYRIGHWRIEVKEKKYRCYNEMSSGKADYSFNTIDELFAFEINGKTIGDYVAKEDDTFFPIIYDDFSHSTSKEDEFLS